MNPTEKFANVVDELNQGIDAFNDFLSADNQLPTIETSNPAAYSDALRRVWGEESWPSKDSYGTYFLLGVSDLKCDRLGVYIGKASMKQMGFRFWSHFKPYRETGDYKKYLRDEPFSIFAICSVPIPSDDFRCIASSLEEFLITRGLDSACLINKIGRRQ